MRTAAVMKEYTEYKRSLGMVFRSDCCQLEAFLRRVGDVELDSITAEQVREYLDGKEGRVTAFWFSKFQTLDRFFQYARSRHYMKHLVLPAALPKRPPKLSPYIYSVEQIRQLLSVPDSCYQPHSAIEPHTMRTLLVLLYGSGLRIGEALRLKLRDVDLGSAVLTILETKFFKSRLVPVGPDLNRLLQRYCERRWAGRTPTSDSPFLCSRKGAVLTVDAANRVFQWLRREAGILRSDGGRYQPRLHDLRHSFAVMRLVTWYREGKDVQRLLPYLATYLGHVHIDDTAIYLTMTKELLQEASSCFARYALSEVTDA
jgi:integrase/recombinase XerD